MQLPKNDGGVWKDTISPGPPGDEKRVKKAKESELPTPFRERALVRAREVAERTAGGLYLPQTTQDKQWAVGDVLAVGEGQATVSGVFIPLPCKVGDVIQFNKLAATPVKAGAEILWLVEDRDMQCKFPKGT